MPKKKPGPETLFGDRPPQTVGRGARRFTFLEGPAASKWLSHRLKIGGRRGHHVFADVTTIGHGAGLGHQLSNHWVKGRRGDPPAGPPPPRVRKVRWAARRRRHCRWRIMRSSGLGSTSPLSSWPRRWAGSAGSSKAKAASIDIPGLPPAHRRLLVRHPMLCQCQCQHQCLPPPPPPANPCMTHPPPPAFLTATQTR